jgi:hypothetical protein
MNKEKAQELIAEAREFLGQNIEITVLDQNNNFKRKASCKFNDWASISISENKDNPSIDLYAKLTDNIDENIHYTPSLKSVVTEFKRLRDKQ